MNAPDVSTWQRAEDARDERYRQQATDDHREARERAAAGEAYLLGQYQTWLAALLREQAREAARRQSIVAVVPYVAGSLADASILAVEIELAIAKTRASIAACGGRS